MPLPSHFPRPRALAFTLIELLVVITIIAVLAGIILPVYGNIQIAGKRTQSLSNMRQLGMAALSYCNDNSDSLPAQGDATSWASAATGTDAENAQWYNVLPRTYGNTRGLGDYAKDTAAFYKNGSMFYVPAAKYPTTKLTAPLFAVAYNSKLITGTYSTRLQLITLPAQTVMFQEAGVPGETPIKGQKAYTTQPSSYASRTAARYNGSTILTFCDGHAAAFTGTSIVDPSSGKAFFASYPTPFPTGAATVYWEMLPTVDPNS